MFSLWVPIINSLIQNSKDPESVLLTFIKHIPLNWDGEIEDNDRKADQLRTYSVLAHYCCKYDILSQVKHPECSNIIIHFINQVNQYSREGHPVFVKYECLNLIGILYNIQGPTKGKATETPSDKQIIGETLRQVINRILNQFFPLWSSEIQPDTREKRHYEMIFDGMINLVTFSKNPHALSLFFRVIKEDETLLEYKLEHAIHVLVKKGFNKLPISEFLVRTKGLFLEFIDFDEEEAQTGMKNEDQSIRNNLKFGVAKRCLLKIFSTCPFEYLTPLVNDLAPKLIKRLQKDFDSTDIKNLMFQLKERGYILRIFECWTTRISQSSTNVKDFYNSIKIRGKELTKCLIKICHYGNFVEIPKLAEGRLDTEQDQKDWDELVNFYIWGCWVCINSIVSHTQGKEGVFTHFLFTSKEDQPPLWDLIIPASTKYTFSVETDFKVKDSRLEKHWEQNKEDDIIKRFNDSFFVNDNLLMSAPMTSNFKESPEKLKRKHDKVREIFDETEDVEMEVEEDENHKSSSEEDDDFELDPLNKHPCMQNILMTIDTLDEKFSQDWRENEMPPWMKKLHSDYHKVNRSAQLFILKLIINRPEVFQKYANQWFGILAEYSISKDNGGKGFHYFLRDICMNLIAFSDNVDIETEENKKYCNEILNQLIKYAADKRRVIFSHNIAIIGSLLEKWRTVVDSLDEEMLGKMLDIKDPKIPNLDLWKMSALQVIALSSKLDIKTTLCQKIIEQLQYRKRSICFVASEVLGVVLSNQPELVEDTCSKIYSMFLGEAKQDLFVGIAQKISKFQPAFGLHSQMLEKLIQYVKPFSASFRASILYTFSHSVKE